MKKILPFVFASMLIVSCGNDDSDSVTTPTDPADPDNIELLPCANARIYILNSQEDVNYYASLGYCSIGELKIGTPDAESDITDLTALSGVLNVANKITIVNNPHLTNLAGLENIINASGDLTISNNAALATLDGLAGLKTVKGNVTITDNAMLTTLDGLTALTTVNGNVTITNNPVLTSAAGLKNVVPAENASITVKDNPLLGQLALGAVTAGDITIDNSSIVDLSGFTALKTAKSINVINNNSFKSLNGLSGLQTLKGLTIVQCSALEDITDIESVSGLETLEVSGTATFNGLAALHNVSSGLRKINLSGNAAITNLEGLNAVTNVYQIRISYNTHLTSLSALGNLKTLKAASSSETAWLNIDHNPVLETLDGLQGVTDFNGILYITENASLKDFCAIQYIIDHGTYTNFFTHIGENLYQPDFTVEGGCSMD